MTFQLGLHVHLGSTWAVGSVCTACHHDVVVSRAEPRHRQSSRLWAERQRPLEDPRWQLPRRTKKLTLARSVFSRRAGLLKHLARHEHDNMRRTRRHEDRQPSHQTNFGLCSGCRASSKMDRLKKRAPYNRRAC